MCQRIFQAWASCLSIWWATRNQAHVYGRIVRPDGVVRENVRLCKRTGRAQFVLWRAGQQGHAQDYWHDMGFGWETYFRPSTDPAAPEGVTRMEIDISTVDLRRFIADVYDLSVPQGMGFLHARSGPLDEATIDAILERGTETYPVDMDYVHGRACKMHVRRDGGKLLIPGRWFDHSDAALQELLQRHQVTLAA